MKKLGVAFLTLFCLLMPSIMKAQTAEELRDLLKVVVEEMNKTCPQYFGDGVYLTKVSYRNNVIIFNMKSDENIYFEDNDREMKREMMEESFSDPDSMFFIQLLAESDSSLLFNFHMPGGVIRRLEYSNRELRALCN